MKILFVCTGNTCRSPMAEAIFNKIIKDEGLKQFESASRGITVYETEPVNPKAQLALSGVGINDFEHTSQKISRVDFNDADIVLTMTQMQKDMLVSLFKEDRYKISTLMEYAYDSRMDIEDPYGKSQIVYNLCAKNLYEIIGKLVGHLKEDFGDEDA